MNYHTNKQSALLGQFGIWTNTALDDLKKLDSGDELVTRYREIFDVATPEECAMMHSMLIQVMSILCPKGLRVVVDTFARTRKE